MGLFGRKKEAAVIEAPPCPHAVLMPRWDSVADMGKDELATHFVCEGCQQDFTPAQASELRGESVGGRLLHQDLTDESRWAAPPAAKE